MHGRLSDYRRLGLRHESAASRPVARDLLDRVAVVQPTCLRLCLPARRGSVGPQLRAAVPGRAASRAAVGTADLTARAVFATDNPRGRRRSMRDGIVTPVGDGLATIDGDRRRPGCAGVDLGRGPRPRRALELSATTSSRS